MLDAQGLRKAYGARAAVADVSLQVGPGEVLGPLARTAPASRRRSR